MLSYLCVKPNVSGLASYVLIVLMVQSSRLCSLYNNNPSASIGIQHCTFLLSPPV